MRRSAGELPDFDRLNQILPHDRMLFYLST